MANTNISMNDYFADFFYDILGYMGHTNIKKLVYDFDDDNYYEYGRRLFYIYDNQHYTVRMWNMYENGDIEFTVYKMISKDNGEMYGEEQIYGIYKAEGNECE